MGPLASASASASASDSAAVADAPEVPVLLCPAHDEELDLVQPWAYSADRLVGCCPLCGYLEVVELTESGAWQQVARLAAPDAA